MPSRPLLLKRIMANLRKRRIYWGFCLRVLPLVLQLLLKDIRYPLANCNLITITEEI
jgi:hypothetical protein